MRYLFKTSTILKRKYSSKYWIDNRMINDIIVESESIGKAIEKYKDIVEKKYYIYMSKSAIKNKQKMYIDNKNGKAQQIGYIFTGKTDIDYKEVFIELWTEIYQSVNF